MCVKMDPAWWFDWKTKCECGSTIHFDMKLIAEGLRLYRVECLRCGRTTRWEVSEEQALKDWMEELSYEQ